MQACGALGAGFDMATRCGVAFSVFDRLRAGALGVLGAGRSHSEAMHTMVRALEVVHATLYAACASKTMRATALQSLLSSLKFLASRLDPLAPRVKDPAM